MSTTQSKANVIVTLNGEAAKNALAEMTAKANEYKKAIREANAAGDSKKANKLERELKQHNSQILNLTKNTKRYQDVLNNLNGSTIRQLNSAAKSLRLEITNHLTPGTAEFIRKTKDLAIVKARIDKVNSSFRKQTSLVSRLGDGFNKYFGLITAGLASITGLSMGLRSAAEDAAKLDDVYSDVMKTTGMTREEVVKLNEEFKKMNTRTSRDALNYLARDAGKLGIAKDEVLGFVNAANQIDVALGEDLGEGAIRNLGKIADVLGLTKKMGVEKSLLAIGSAINAVGQDSTANEAYLVDFTQRLAGVGAQTGISVQNLIGYGSGLDQSAMRVEMAATAFQTFIMDMYSDTATFAKHAGMGVEEFTELLNTDANAAIIKVLTSLNAKGGFNALVPIFKDMGAEGARAVSVLSSIASNLDAVTQAQALSNKEFEKGTSISDEYAIKNNNKMAQLEKARKQFKDVMIEFGEGLSPIMLQTTKIGTLAIKFLATWGKELLILGGIITGIIVLLKTKAFLLGTLKTIQATYTVGVALLSLAYGGLTGNIIKAKRALVLLKQSFKLSILGVIATAIFAIGAAIYKATERQRVLNKTMREFYVETAKLKLEANSLLDILKNNEKGSDLYNEALKKLQETYDPYIKHLINEKGYLTDISEARNIVNSEIERSIGLKMKEQAIEEITKRHIENQAEIYEDIVRNIKKGSNVGEEAARVLANQAFAMNKNGKSLENVYSTLFSDKVVNFGLWSMKIKNNLKTLSKEHSSFISDIETVNTKFSFLPPLPTDYHGPFLLDGGKKQKDEDTKKPPDLSNFTFDEQLILLDGREKAEQNLLKKSYLKKKLSKEVYENQSEQLTLNFLARRNAMYIKYSQDNIDVEGQYMDALIAQQQKGVEEMERLEKILNSWNKELSESIDKKFNVDVEIDFDSNDAEIQSVLDEFASLQARAEEVRNKIAFVGIKERSDAQKANLDEQLSEGVLSQEDYEKAILALKLENIEDYADIATSFLQQIASISASMQDIEYNKIEASKNRELALYGNTADKRAEIENKYEQQKLDTQKKYADIDMGIKLSQAIAAGALASIQAWNAAGGNPILAAIFMGLIATTTAFQVASIIAQRNAIKSSAGSSSSSTSTTRTVLAEHYEGGYTATATSDHQVAGIVHANEWVAPAAMVRANPTVFATLENQRTRNKSKGFFDGGHTTSIATPSTPDTSNSSISQALLIETLNKVIYRLDIPIEAYLDYNKFKEYEGKINRFKKTGSR